MNKERWLIDANKLREDWLENGENEFVYDTNAVLDSIDAQPRIDAAPVVHGRWKRTPTSQTLYCSACDKIPEYQIETNYCHNCGARMDGDQHE